MCISVTVEFQLCEKLLISTTVSINWCVFQLLISVIVIKISLLHVDCRRSLAAFPYLVIKYFGTGSDSLIHQQWNGPSPTLDAVACPYIEGTSRQRHIIGTILPADVLLPHVYDRLCWTTGKPWLAFTVTPPNTRDVTDSKSESDGIRHFFQNPADT